MAMESLTLVANPGSASRKYAVFDGERRVAAVHFEHDGGRPVCTVATGTAHRHISVDAAVVHDPIRQLRRILKENNLIHDEAHVGCIGLRVVAPTGLFLQDHVLDEHMIAQLEAVRDRAPLHIEATLRELHALRRAHPDVPIVGVSDSQFHATKPDFAWNYGLPLADSDRFEIKRFGYHGISAASVVRTLQDSKKLPPKLIICHLGSGASVTAVLNGQSVDTTMGYSPLEGLVMATRSGTIDVTAAHVLKCELHLDDAGLEKYLNEHSGLLGLSGSSSDIRTLLRREADGDQHAGLALKTFVYSAQKAIGQMATVLAGADMIVFTGTVGERSVPIRQRIMQPFHYLDFALDDVENQDTVQPVRPVCVSKLGRSRPVYVIPTDEAQEIARRTRAVLQH